LPVDVQHLRFQKRRAITGDNRDIQFRISNFEFRIYQKMISKSLMPFHFPGMSGSNDVCSTQVPYFAGAPGLSIWNGFPPRIACGTTPVTSGRCKSGGGVAIARTGFCGPIGAVYVCAEAVVTSAARIAIHSNVLMFFLSCECVQVLARHNACPHYTLRWTILKRPLVSWT